jgi:hypothetical protein
MDFIIVFFLTHRARLIRNWMPKTVWIFLGQNSAGGVTVSPSPQSKDEENEKLHELRRYARDFRRQHTTDAERFDWDSDDGDYGLAIGRLVVM